jgi:hypothetical protein
MTDADATMYFFNSVACHFTLPGYGGKLCRAFYAAHTTYWHNNVGYKFRFGSKVQNLQDASNTTYL